MDPEELRKFMQNKLAKEYRINEESIKDNLKEVGKKILPNDLKKLNDPREAYSKCFDDSSQAYVVARIVQVSQEAGRNEWMPFPESEEKDNLEALVVMEGEGDVIKQEGAYYLERSVIELIELYESGKMPLE